MHFPGAWHEIFKVYAREERTRGITEMSYPAFFAGHFQYIKTKEYAVGSCLFYPPLVLTVR